MNDVDLLILAVEKEPHNDIVAAMLIDELMGERDMIRSEAERHVTAVQLASINAREIAQVAALFACPGPARDRVMTIVTNAWPANAHPTARIHVVVGDTPPMKAIGDSTDTPSPFLDVVYIGAKFILARVPKPLLSEAVLFCGNITTPSQSKKKRR